MALARHRRLPRKRRTREHVIADLSVNHVEKHVLLCGHVVERRVRDYGIDLVLVTFDANGEVQAGEVQLQLKATDHLRVISSGTMIAQRLEPADLAAWLEHPMPVILVVYDAGADLAYWLYVQAHFERRSGVKPRKGTTSLTVRVPRANVLDRTAVRRFARFRDQVMAQTIGKIHHHE
jgi:Domain of unknown function (DUF4365)